MVRIQNSIQFKVFFALVFSIFIHVAILMAVFLWPVNFSEELKSFEKYSIVSVQIFQKVLNSSLSKNSNVQQGPENAAGKIEKESYSQQQSLHDSYQLAIVAQIQKHQYYPRLALKLGQEGEPVVKIIVDKSGHLVEAKLEKSCGTESLDNAALDIVKKAHPFPPPPKEYLDVLQQSGATHLVFRAPIGFDISRAGL